MRGLHNLKAPRGANKNRKRIGRGESSGWGKTAGSGHKGQKARTGKGKPGPGFEGGQMPMYRRLPKRGFRNIFAVAAVEVNLDILTARFAAGETVDLESLRQRGLARRQHKALRVLARGELGHALVIRADHFSAAAKEKIIAAGGEAVVVSAASSAA